MKFGNRAVSVALVAAISFSGIFASANAAKNKRKNNNGLRKDNALDKQLKKSNQEVVNRKLSKGGSKGGKDEAPMRNGALDEGEEPIVLGDNKTPEKAGAIAGVEEDYYQSNPSYPSYVPPPPPCPAELPDPPPDTNCTGGSSGIAIENDYMCMARYAYEEEDIRRKCHDALKCTNDMTALKFKYTGEGCPEPADGPDDPFASDGINYRCMERDFAITGGFVWIIKGDHFDKLNNTAVQPKTMDHLSWFMKYPHVETIYKSEIWIDEEYSFEIKNDEVDYTADDVTYMAFDKYGNLALFATWNLACDADSDDITNNYSIGNFFANSMFTGFKSDRYGAVSSHIYPQFEYTVMNDCEGMVKVGGTTMPVDQEGLVASLVRTYRKKECGDARFSCPSVEHYNPFQCVKKIEDEWYPQIQAGCKTDDDLLTIPPNGGTRTFTDLFSGKGAVDLLTTEIKVEVDVMVKYHDTWLTERTWKNETIDKTRCPDP